MATLTHGILERVNIPCRLISVTKTKWTARGDGLKDPYSALINHMREQGGKNNTPYIQVGIVVTSDPLIIKLGDLQLGKDNLLIADYLLSNYARKYSASGNITFTESGSAGATDGVAIGPYGTHMHNVNEININTVNAQTGDLTLTDGLKTDDVVAITPLFDLDVQMYAVLARLVRA